MIGKITKGASARGLIAYISAPHDHEGREREQVIALGGTMPGRTAQEIAAGFERLAELRPALRQPCAHLMLRWTADDRPSLDEQAEMAEAHASALGYRHWFAYSHGDHLHIAASRVNADGSKVSDSWDWKRAEGSVRALEKRFGLVEVASSHLLNPESKDGHRTAPSAAEIGASQRGEASIRLQLQAAVDAALGDGASFPEFTQRLQVMGVGVRPNLQQTGTIAGLSFALDGLVFKASRLGKRYTWGALQRRGLVYDQSKDSEIARQLSHGQADTRTHDNDGSHAGGGNGNRRNARAAGAADPAFGKGDSEPHGRDPAHHADAPPLHEAGASHEPGQHPDDDSGSPDCVTEDTGAAAEASREHQESGSCEQASNGRSLSLPCQDSDHCRGVGRTAPSGSGTGSGLEAGAAAIDAEAFDGTEDALAALRKWARNTRRAMTSTRKPTNTRPPIATPPFASAPALFHLSAVAAVRPARRDRTLAQVRAQIDAMGCELFEVKVLPPRHRTDLRPERTRKFTAAQVTAPATVAWLKRMNALDRDIYVKPAPLKEGRLAPLVFVNGLDTSQLEAMAAAGLPLAVAVESSPGSFHGWVRIGSQPITKEEATALARELARRFGGDPAASAYGRLAGFTNRKASRRTSRGAPFARLHGTSSEIAPAGRPLLTEARSKVDRERRARRLAEQRVLHRRKAAAALGGDHYLASVASVFSQVRAGIRTTRPHGSPDEDAKDFGAACELLRQGYEDTHVIAAILEASPGLFERHPTPDEYALHIVQSARRSKATMLTKKLGFKSR